MEQVIVLILECILADVTGWRAGQCAVINYIIGAFKKNDL